MSIAASVKEYLDKNHIQYDVVHHPRTESSMETAEITHIKGDQLAKSVLLEDESGYVLAIIPSTYYVELDKISNRLERDLELATETEISSLFQDCARGAIPVLGPVYKIPTIVEDDLMLQPDIYFEAGDHQALVHLSGRQFRQLVSDMDHGHLSRHL